MTFLKKIEALYQQKLPFVALKKPFSSEIEIIQQTDNQVHIFDNSFSVDGFVFAPFDTETQQTFLLKADKKFLFQHEITDNQSLTKKNLPKNEIEKKQHISLVEKAIEAMKSGEFEKVVLSRSIQLDYQGNLAEIFSRMIQLYPSAFCYAFFHPTIGSWAAATPEKLLKFTDNQVVTMSLAGTQPYKETEISWQKKEIEEQQIVTETIIKNLNVFSKNICVGDVKTIRAGNLAHLCTEISAELPQKTNPFSVALRLHPTPAVCGFPTEKAKKFILENENYDRSFYTGFCGIIHSENKSFELYVNLRCMQLIDNQCVIYVGGGILKNSNAEAEWEETQNKAQTMLNVL